MRARAFTALALVFVGAAVVWTQQPKPAEQEANERKKIRVPATPASLRRLLDMPIPIPEEFKQQVPLRLVFKYIEDQLGELGQTFPIWIDQNAFKEDAADAGDLLDTNVTYPPFLRAPKLRTYLEIGLSQMPGQNATYLVRGDYLEVTTNALANPAFRLDTPIAVDFRDEPIGRIIEQLSDMTGVSILLDDRLLDLTKKTTQLRSNGDISLRGALQTLADTYDLRLVVDEHRVFLTSQQHYLERLQARVAEAKAHKELADTGEPRPAPENNHRNYRGRGLKK
jgi:hypothetical protein